MNRKLLNAQSLKLSSEESLELNKIEVLRTNLRVSKRLANITADLTQINQEGSVCLDFLARRAAKGRGVCLNLYKLIRKFKPEICIEFGTSLGISGLYQATALKFNGGGKLVTFEGLPEVALIARENFKSFGFDHVEVIEGLFEETLSAALSRYDKIDYVFHDATVNKKSRLHDFYKCLPLMSENSLFVVSCANRTAGNLNEAWGEMQGHKRVADSTMLPGANGILIFK